ncbi:hypothetical protein [Flavobacterium granuli]|uniref:Lipoprotein n=1 Tax=Flavobacterium granuli TaxID=280093 RepID=A0A1M5NJM2_9FLAO|nr:hypothetical protein [Flavobacterium granuli]PRZ23308.1 hypothetical protein BC624_10530 [Flavobacterium granuli]SHG89794.1 hypothetical protein SAMN05443373_10530 [Flavobacterium granuli]
MKTNLIKRLLFVLLIPILISSCEADTSGYGNYIIGVSNASSKKIQMEVVLDGQSQGIFFVMAGQQGNYSSLCNDLVHAANLDNVRILTFVSSGKHKLKLQDFDTKFVFIETTFEMKADDCISQQFNLN